MSDSADQAPDQSPGLPTPDARHGEPEPATVAELAEDLARTPAEQAALDALAGNPDGQALEMLVQHFRHEQAKAKDEPGA